jgi:hypothetical protein
MSKKEKLFSIEPVKELPAPIKAKVTVYDQVLSEILPRPKGIYQISIQSKNIKSVYPAIAKRIKDQKLPLKLHIRTNQIYLEKLE